MSNKKLPEVWLRGPIEGVGAALQPTAHALTQAREEILALMDNFPDELLWVKPGGLASPAFHLQHITGVIDRMITYAGNKPLTTGQLTYLENEGKFVKEIKTGSLLMALENRIDKALYKIKYTDTTTLADHRAVGRKQLPSTVGGLLFHMAEHTMRHTGQLLVTVRILQNRV